MLRVSSERMKSFIAPCMSLTQSVLTPLLNPCDIAISPIRDRSEHSSGRPLACAATRTFERISLFAAFAAFGEFPDTDAGGGRTHPRSVKAREPSACNN